MSACVTASFELALGDHYIPEYQIIDPEHRSVAVPYQYQGKSYTSNLTPDAFFGMPHKDKRRIFAVEVDRASENVRTRKNIKSRKTIMRNFLQYRELIGKGRYKELYGFNDGLLLLYITTNQAHMQNMIDLLLRITEGRGNNYILFTILPMFGRHFKPPEPLDLLTRPWYRAGMEPFYINK